MTATAYAPLLDQTMPMLADIARQPAVLLGLASRADAIAAAGLRHLKPGPGGRIFVSGCGDGLFAAEAASGFAASVGLDWRAISALDLVLTAAQLGQQDRVLCISMSGNVDRTVEAAKAVAAAGVPLLALVNGGGGRLGDIAAEKLSLDLPDIAPFLCGTASYTATLAVLMLLAAGAAGSAPPDLARASAAQQAAITASHAAFAHIPKTQLTGVRLLSAGADIGTVRYGAAKFVELSSLPSWAGDLEEFAHSQYWSTPTSDLIVIVAADGKLAEYADASCSALAQLPLRTLAIDTNETPVAAATHRITLPAIPAALAPLATALPLQLLAYHVAIATGFDPNTRLHLKNDTARFTVSRQLTRRSLLGTGQ